MNFIPTNPANAVDALRLARTTEKAKAIIADGYDFELYPEIEVVTVRKPGVPYADYFINLSASPVVFPLGCSCPDFQQRGRYCKHTIAWGLIQEEREEEANQLAGAPSEEEEYGRAWYEERAALRA